MQVLTNETEKLKWDDSGSRDSSVNAANKINEKVHLLFLADSCRMPPYATSAITIHQSHKVLYTFSEYFPTLPLLVHVFTAITMELFVCQENFFAMM